MQLEEKNRLQEQLLFVLLVALAPFLFFAGIQAYNEAKDVRGERRAELSLRGERAIDAIEASLATSSAVLDVLKTQIVNGECGAAFGQIKAVAPMATKTAAFNADGIATCSSAGDSGYAITNPDWIEALADDRKLVRTDAFFGPQSETWIVSILRRVESPDGQFIGAASVSISIEDLLRAAVTASPDVDNRIAIMDNSGRVFGTTPWNEVPSEWLEKAKAAGESTLRVYDPENGRRLDVVINPLRGAGLYAVLTAPTPRLLSNATLRPITTIGTPLVVFATAIIAAWFGLDRLVLQWLRPLRRMAVAYADGRYDFKPEADFETAPREIAKLSATMQRMATRIGERDADLREALEAKEASVREVHHRVKNNLQIVNSFVNLQSRELSDSPAKDALLVVKNRIEALSIVHQTLYQNERLELVSLNLFFEDLLTHLTNALGLEDVDIQMSWDIKCVDRHSDDAIPLALFTLEAVTNSTKYAFEGAPGEIAVKLHCDDDGENLVLEIIDNGRKAKSNLPPPEPAEGDLSANTSTGLGSRLMTAFARQVGGEYESVETDTGRTVRLYIPPSK